MRSPRDSSRGLSAAPTKPHRRTPRRSGWRFKSWLRSRAYDQVLDRTLPRRLSDAAPMRKAPPRQTGL